MSSQSSPKPGTGLDATFRDPPSPDPANFVFNTDANWIGGRVPDGTGTIASEERGEVTFNKDLTEIGALNLTGYLFLKLAALQTLKLTAPDGTPGTLTAASLITFSGLIKGNVVLNHRDRDHRGWLVGTWEAPVGTIEGAVANVSGTVCPGGPNVSSVGKMTIRGSYVQGNASELLDAPRGNLAIAVDKTGVSCLNVIGSANLLRNTSVTIIAGDPQGIPLGKAFPILTTTKGLKGVFKSVVAIHPFNVEPSYDNNNVYITLTR